MGRKKLIQFDTCLAFGSTGQITENLGKMAQQNGWDCYIVHGARFVRHNSCMTSLQSVSVIGEYLHCLHSFLFDRHGFGSYFATKRLLRKFDKIKPDLFQFHNVHGYYLNLPLVLKYATEKNIPIVWSLHDCWSMTGHCSHFVGIGCERWKTECHHCPQRKAYPKSLFLDMSRCNYREKKQLIQNVPRLSIISGSEWLANIARQSYFSNREVHFIPDGIDTDIYQPRFNGDEIRKKLGLVGKFVMLATGTVWGESKGLSDYGKLRKMLSDDYAIVLVGMEEESLARVPEGVIGLPRTKNQIELSEYYSMADCVMSLSKMESFGLTPVEGFACGTPAIVYDTTALPELITPETGYVARFLDVEDVKDKVEMMRKKGKAFYTEKCREIAVNTYGRKRCYQEYLKLYDNMLVR